MEMTFTYEEFKKDYLQSSALCPKMPFLPVEILDHVKFFSDMSNCDIEGQTRKTYTELKKRMGGDYFSKFDRVQSRSKAIALQMFPPYQMLFLDITCEDWLSLVDFHKDFSRDHSVHQPLTAYIVCKLLGGGNPEAAFKIGGKSLLTLAAEAILDEEKANAAYLQQRLKEHDANAKLLTSKDKNLWMSVFYQTAIITAMYHDIGYPWQFMENMHNTLDDDSLLCGKLKEDDLKIHEYINNHREELMFRPFYDYGRKGKTVADINCGLFEKALHNTHGLPGALAYTGYNKKYNSDNVHTEGFGTIRFCQEWSSLAILMHDMGRIYEKHKDVFPRLDFTVDPLSYIIALADTLEDFNRPSAEISPTEKGCEITYNFPSLDVKFVEDENGEAAIHYTVSPENKTKQEEFKKKEEEKLFNPFEGYFDLDSLGLKKVTINVHQEKMS